MKKVVAIALSLLILSSSSLYVGAFIIVKNRVRREVKLKIKRGIPIHELESFVFSANDFNELHFLKPDEFSFQGHLYDIVYSQFNGGLYYLKCVADEQETELYAQLNQKVRGLLDTNSSTKSMAKNAKTSFKVKYLPSHLNFKYKPKKQTQTNHNSNTTMVLDGYLKNPFHPPQVQLSISNIFF